MMTDSSDVDFTYDDTTGTISATVSGDSITNAKLANMNQATLKGRASGAGTGDPTDLTAAQVAAILDAVAHTFTKATVHTPVALTDAATIATDASLGNRFRVTLGGNRTLGAPTNPTDGQQCIWEITQHATGGRTLALATGAGGFAYGTDITSVTLTTTANATDYLTAIYHATANRWRVVGFIIGEVRDWEFGSPPCGWVFAIDIDPGARQAGVGTKLLAAISDRFRRAGVEKLRTLLSRDNTLILSFFRAQGMMSGPLIPLEMDLR